MLFLQLTLDLRSHHTAFKTCSSVVFCCSVCDTETDVIEGKRLQSTSFCTYDWISMLALVCKSENEEQPTGRHEAQDFHTGAGRRLCAAARGRRGIWCPPGSPLALRHC